MTQAKKDSSSARMTRDSIHDVWGARTPYYGPWPVRVDELVSAEPDHWVQSCCLLCSNGCGLDIGVKDGKIVGVRGRAVDRVNHGRLGPKGLHAWMANNSSERLTTPLIRKKGRLTPASWDEAMNLLVDKTRETLQAATQHAIGFYTTGQLFLEEYYALALIGKAGLGTNHMDGNTRLCTATAAAAMRESFGCDGQPGSYTDIDTTDCIFLVGHNIANTQTVLWARMLDRLHGPRPPQIIVVDPRRTATAREATLHLAPKIGTNLALLNGLLHLLIKNEWVDASFIAEHTVGYEDLCQTVASYTPHRVAEITGLPPAQIEETAAVLGNTPSLLSTVLQGVYQSNQATASACQVNNIHLLRGLIGREGSGIYQMNGQPTAQNNRETGCNGEYTGFRNYLNKAHMQDLAEHWNVDLHTIPHWSVPTPIMEMLNLMESGSIKFFWISATNPAVSLPNLRRVRKILSKSDLFVVVQDAFLTETAKLADVVLPAALWGEKTGTFTNVDRTVHISHKAVEPPGEARSDFDIFLDYARRMGFKDKEGKPLIKWGTPEQAFDAWRASTRGRPCDYTGITYAKLSAGSGIQWPCNDENPQGTERLYADHCFPTDLEHCETYGHDLETGASISRDDYARINPAGRAILKAAHYRAPEEQPDAEYPFWLTTGRLTYHFHTRTKTGRSPELEAAAPQAFAELSQADAEALGVKDGDLVAVSSRRATLEVPARIGDIKPGHLFIPFHYGYWDAKDHRARAANELTLTGWDPVSKQPYFKFCAVKISKLNALTTGVKVVQGWLREEQGQLEQRTSDLKQRFKTKHPHLGEQLALFHQQLTRLAVLYEEMLAVYASFAEVRQGLKTIKSYTVKPSHGLKAFLAKYSAPDPSVSIRRLDQQAFAPSATRQPESYALLQDLLALIVEIEHISLRTTILLQASKAIPDPALQEVLQAAHGALTRQQAWVLTQINNRSAQTLLVPS